VKVRILSLALVASLAAASVALAKDGPRPARPDGAGSATACKVRGTFVLRGTFLAGGPTTFQMDVRRASSRGRMLRGPRELKVDARTKIRRNGRRATLGGLQAGDRLLVLVRGCKRSASATMELLARHVSAHAKAA
jgi:hypothetical protein